MCTPTSVAAAGTRVVDEAVAVNRTGCSGGPGVSQDETAAGARLVDEVAAATGVVSRDATEGIGVARDAQDVGVGVARDVLEVPSSDEAWERCILEATAL